MWCWLLQFSNTYPILKGAVEAALNLLQPDGILIFEVPLIRTKDDVWFRSSLEHLHYPTDRSIQYLFNTILGLDLYGSAVDAQDWGSIYVGMTSKSRNVSQECGARFETLIAAPVQSLSPGEARFRCLFDLGVATLERRSKRQDIGVADLVRCGIASRDQSRRRGIWL